MRKSILAILLTLSALTANAQASYIAEQLGRDAHHIVQSLGAFVGNERAESQQFDITYMPAGNRVEGVMIINTADYRCTFKMDPTDEKCYEVIIDVRSADFLRDFNRLFQVYHTENPDGDDKTMHFGDKLIRVRETTSTTSRFRSFTLTEKN
ncbi:MAG: hypothetical protein K5918_07085 [Bacteroidales bacterium]|nr:hypothetical protein [Bacteroidales bacterium]